MALSLSGRILHSRISSWLNINDPTRSRPWTTLTKLLVTFCLVVLLTLVIDCGVLTVIALNDPLWTSTMWNLYAAGLFASWILCLWTLIDELDRSGIIYWMHYAFWWISLLVETSMGWLRTQTVEHLEPGLLGSLYDQVLFGTFITRYIIQWLLVLFSVAHMISGSSTISKTTCYSNMNETIPSLHHGKISETNHSPFFVLLVFGMVISACTPYHIGKDNFAWTALLGYVGFKIIQEGSGLYQHTLHATSIKLFKHLDIKNMLDLSKEQQTVEDMPSAFGHDIVEGTIEFDNVTFAYNDHHNTLNGISFTVPSQSTVALVGPTGSGKSIIIRLLFRLYNPTSGTISIDGQNISSINQSSLMRKISVVPPECVIFDDTIMTNLLYGNSPASVQEVYEASKAAQIHNKIMSFPNGYDTVVGEGGLGLSTGEKQLLGIGRAIINNPPILILNEAINSRDKHLQQVLPNITKNRTTIVVAHRLSTVVVNADLILVMKDGHVAESGTHEELLKQGKQSTSNNESIYWNMWQELLLEYDNDADSSHTFDEMKNNNLNEDNADDPNDNIPTATNITNNKFIVESHILIPDQQISDTVSQLAIDCSNSTNYNQQIEPSSQSIPSLDIPSMSTITIAPVSTNHQACSSSRVKPSDSQKAKDGDEMYGSPTIPVCSIPDDQQQQTPRGKGNNKHKPKNKGKKNGKKKRKSPRNDTTFG
ncbi:P-loop containing nucleoside triphosphate hydrolase protein [Chlamydoabsidia padenii]|nr:P-loop containing nucleoside triphosphate hydrolase protein [Chlamydoabsidia padenii]